MEQMEQPSLIQALPATPKKDKESHSANTSTTAVAAASPQAAASTSRRTRLQVAPDWTTYESLVLVSEIAAMDEDWIKALSSYQKWKMISDNCVALDVIRSSIQCKRRWESLLAGYRKIREWESRHGEGSYWTLDGEKKQHLDLPTVFDPDVFGSMDAVIKPQEYRAGSGGVGLGNLIDATGGLGAPLVNTAGEMMDINDAQGSKENAEDETQDRARDMASKLQEHAQQIHAILRGELEDKLGLNPSQVDLKKPSAADIEFTRFQADQLIKALRGLVGPLNQFTELIRAGD